MDNHTRMFIGLSQFVQHHLLWFLIGAYALAAVFPNFGLWIRKTAFGDMTIWHEQTHVSLLVLMLALLMFNAGLGVKMSHLQAVLHKKRVVLAGLTANMVIPMAYIFGVTPGDAALVRT